MRRYIVLLFMSVLYVLGVNAQQEVIITLTDGTVQKYETWEVKNITFQPVAPVEVTTQTEAIDLGLSVKWASFNFGAENETGAGLYVGWGDVTGKNYSTNADYFPMATPLSGIVAGSYDIVASMWGDEWRMPSAEEVQELIDGCMWTYDTDKKGYTITSKSNGNRIFLPFTGYRLGKNEPTETDSRGYYWTGSLGTSDNTKAIALMVDGTAVTKPEMERYLGYTIRPVYGKYLYGSEVNGMSVSNLTSTTASLTVTFVGDYAKASEFGICYSTDEASLTSDSGHKMTVTSVAEDGTCIFNITGLTPNTTYYYMAYVVYNGNSNDSGTSYFTTEPKFKVPTVEQAVDLGLSVKWAPWNVGASSVNDYGSYIAWGDPTGENTSFTASDYPNDTDDIKGTDYDVAHVQWGGKWRMPTSAELMELDKLDKQIVRRDGVVTGFLLTSTEKGTQLFIPCSGYQNMSGIEALGDKAYYWASERVSLDNASSCTIGKVASEIEDTPKVLHMSVRPVYDETIGETPIDPDAGETAEGKKASASLVDLGLSVRWASYNIGATAETAAGEMIAWGETAAKSSYTLDNYALYENGSYTDVGYDIKGTEYDPAHVRWGGSWRMPTDTEWRELIDGCTWEWSASKHGYTVTSNSNGKSIFLYAGGYGLDSSYYVGVQGCYWSSCTDNLVTHKNDNWSYMLSFGGSDPFVQGVYRYRGCSVRPVKP